MAARAVRAVDALAAIEGLLEREAGRIDDARKDLSRAREALHGLRRIKGAEDHGRVIEPLPDDLVGATVTRFFAESRGLVRNVINVVDAGPAFEEVTIDGLVEFLDGGGVQQSLYPVTALESVAGSHWIRTWAARGEVQRVLPSTPTEFAVFGDAAVITFAQWGDPTSGYVVIREPVVVAAFAGFFDAQWGQALPMSGVGRVASDDKLVELLGLGLKDEAIARYLGIGLRTVRRHVSRLMELHGVDTRFQLGVSLASGGHPGLAGPVSGAAQRRHTLRL